MIWLKIITYSKKLISFSVFSNSWYVAFWYSGMINQYLKVLSEFLRLWFFKKLVYLIFEIFMLEYSVYTVSSIPCSQIFLCLPTSFKTIISSLILSYVCVCGECVLCMSVCVWCEWCVCVVYKLSSLVLLECICI